MPSIKLLVIVFKVEPDSKGCMEATSSGPFYNEDTEVHAWSEVKVLNHYRWLQGPMAHLPHERQLEYVAVTM